ncbi:MAG: LysM peptidoglycan-binding domain-containing protein [Granulosicoccaceae bacterium]
MSIKKLLAVALLTVSLGTSGFAADPALNPNHPDQYTVVKGDTLWDIAGRFLRDPWRWPDIWHANQQIANPHLIYPGDVITLTYDANGKPILTVKRGRQTIKLGPSVRAERLERAIPTIPLDAIRQFLNRPLVVSEEELDNAPYVVETAGEHIVVGAGDSVYVRGLAEANKGKYSVYRPGQVYRNPGADKDDESQILGYEAIFVGEGQLTYFKQDEEVSTLALTSTTREARRGDRVMPVRDDEFDQNFMPHAPANEVEAAIIAVSDGVSQIGQHNIVVLNNGAREGIEIGHVLSVYRRGDTISDPVTTKDRNDSVKLPDELAGTIMVFRVFDKVSYALVMEAKRPMHLFDFVRKPSDL